MSYHQKIPIRGGLYPEKGVRWPCHIARKRAAINVYGVIMWNWVITDGCTVLGRCKRRCGPSRNWVNTNSCSVPEGTASISTTVPHRTNQRRYIQLHRTEPCRCDRLKSQQESPNNAPHPKKTPLDRKRRRTPPSHRPEGLRREARAEPTERPHHEGRKKEEKGEPRSLNRAPWTRVEAQEEPGLYGNKLDRNS